MIGIHEPASLEREGTEQRPCAGAPVLEQLVGDVPSHGLDGKRACFVDIAAAPTHR